MGTEYFKHGVYCPFFPLQNAVCFIIQMYWVPVLFTFYIQGVPKLKKNNSGAKRLKKVKQSRSRKLKFPDFVTTAQDGGRLSALRTGRLYPYEILLVLISISS